MKKTTYSEKLAIIKAKHQKERDDLKAKQKNDTTYAKNKHKSDLLEMKQDYNSARTTKIKNQKAYLLQLKRDQEAAKFHLKNAQAQEIQNLRIQYGR